MPKTYELHCGDCVEELTRIPDHSADAVIFDPPFIPLFAAYRQVHKKTKHKMKEIFVPGEEGEGVKKPRKQQIREWTQWWIKTCRECVRILKKEGWLIFKADAVTAKHVWCYMPAIMSYASEIIYDFADIAENSAEIIWDKEVIGLGYYVRSEHEHLEVYRPPGATNSFCNMKPKARKGLKAAWHGNGKGNSFPSVMHVRKLNEGSKQLSPTATSDDHINETPIEVWMKVITHFVPEGGLIVDPTMGSGSVGKAAILLGRQYWGCELDPEFYGKAERKLAKVQPLRKLFDYSAEVVVDAEINKDSVRDLAETGDPLSHMWKGR